jgi:hypothetical protein
VDGDILEIHDLISSKTIDIEKIVSTVIGKEVKKVRFSYTPDFSHEALVKEAYEDEDSTFYIMSKTPITLNEKYPLTAQA